MKKERDRESKRNTKREKKRKGGYFFTPICPSLVICLREVKSEDKKCLDQVLQMENNAHIIYICLGDIK